MLDLNESGSTTLASTSTDAKRSVAGIARHFVLYWLPVIAWMALIFALSHSSDLESVQRGYLWWIPSELKSQYFVHPVEFGVLAALAYRLLASYRTTPAALVFGGALAFTICYGVTDEFHQSFVAGRSSSISDVGLDTLGAVVGVWLGPLLRWEVFLRVSRSVRQSVGLILR